MCFLAWPKTFACVEIGPLLSVGGGTHQASCAYFAKWMRREFWLKVMYGTHKVLFFSGTGGDCSAWRPPSLRVGGQFPFWTITWHLLYTRERQLKTLVRIDEKYRTVILWIDLVALLCTASTGLPNVCDISQPWVTGDGHNCFKICRTIKKFPHQ